MGDKPSSGQDDSASARVVGQRIRNRVIEYFEIAASFKDQVEYAAAVPNVNVPYEMINAWEDWVDVDHLEDSEVSFTYSPAEAEEMRRYKSVWLAASDVLPKNFPTIEYAHALPEWEAMRAAAAVALTEFRKRGKMSEDVEEFNSPSDLRELSATERSLLEFLISAMSVGRAEAQAQLKVAKYAGLGHPGTHVCFNVQIPDDAPLIPAEATWPLLFDVDAPPDAPLTIELFARSGRLQGVDLTTYADDKYGSSWPALERIHPTTRDVGK
jgi:hypothetical protein